MVNKNIDSQPSFLFSDEKLNQIAFPLGGIGSGMICFEGTGALSNFSLNHKPDVFNEPMTFSALSLKWDDGQIAKVLEGPVPSRKIFGNPGNATGSTGSSYGLPRFKDAEFSWSFPFAEVVLSDDKVPVNVAITGWSPFIPNDADNSSLPFAALEFKITNISEKHLSGQYSFNAKNFVSLKNDNYTKEDIALSDNSFTFQQKKTEKKPWAEAFFKASIEDSDVIVDPAWFRGSWYDPMMILWKNIETRKVRNRELYADEFGQGSGATLAVPINLSPGKSKTVKLSLIWYVPQSNLRIGALDNDSSHLNENVFEPDKYYRPWYASEFSGINQISSYVSEKYSALKKRSRKFSETFYSSDLPVDVLEAVSANFAILKSPTVLRQHDGKIWAWEGCGDDAGSCYGSCTHVWNYAQVIAHLFPDLERSFRETEFFESQNEEGHQNFRSALPIGPTDHEFQAAADGQLGGIMKVYREWRISNDTQWLENIFPKLKQSLDYCIKSWDPEENGILREPHHNTYDIEFWGPDGMCSSIYLGALKAFILISKKMGTDYSFYEKLLSKGKKYLEENLFNGEYFIQNLEWKNLNAGNPVDFKSMLTDYSKEALEILQKEGPKYQYGNGCLSDGIIGDCLAKVCGVESVIDEEKVEKHLLSVYKYNFRKDLSEHANPQRPAFALGKDGGLVLCTWPYGDKLSLPFIYSNEIWTGIEYQLAAHLAILGHYDKALDIVKTLRTRYDGSVRNPFDEYECGHWYARALASYSLIQAFSGIRYDAVEKNLEIDRANSEDFKCFISVDGGYGIAGIKDGDGFIDVKSGKIPVDNIRINISGIQSS